LINRDIELISDDRSSRGSKTFIIYNPPVIDEKLGIRASLQQECIRLASDLIQRNFQTILFTRTRRNVEFLLSKLQSSFPEKSNTIKSYRSGYLPSQRRKIEKGLKNGSIRTVTATNALELGIDIGGLDAAILAGYPGTIAGTLQQAGRSGRTTDDSLSILVTSSSPLDQYLAQHPEYIFETNPEKALINPENLLIALNHLECALYELPFDDGLSYGRFTPDQTREFLNIIKNRGKAYLKSHKYYWSAENYPAKDISLRTASMDRLLLQVETSSKKHRNLGSIDKESSYWMVHPGAIYLHEGESYLVEDLDFDNSIVLLSPTSLDYYTEAESQTNFQVLNLMQTDQIPGGQKHLGEIKVTSQVTGYKKIKWNQYQVLSRENLDLPATSLTTQGYWITISPDTEEQLRLTGNWSSSPNEYGKAWNSIREDILIRDNNRCQMCGFQGSHSSLHIHHKIPIRNFTNLKEAHSPDNLISLCPRCHKKAELVVKINSGIRGISYVLHALAPLFLMCDPSDLGAYSDFKSPFGDSRPLSLIFELIPAGIGFSRTLYHQHDSLVKKARGLVFNCPCSNGCPSCVGPGGEMGSGGKEEALALLNYLVQ
jgi:DEAD/DEAH box helicase domain-containing protein